jgi:putative tricarboxylic transport membrane protein
MAALGLLLGMIGIDQMSAYFRFAYGIAELGDGIGVVPVAVGLFGLAEILLTAGMKNPAEVIRPRLRDLLPSRQEWRESNIADLARHRDRLPHRHHPGLRARDLDFVSYAVERKVSKRPEEFGAARWRACGAGVGQQRGDLGRLRADAGPRRARRADRRACSWPP